MNLNDYTIHSDTLCEIGSAPNICKEMAFWGRVPREGGTDPVLEGQLGIHLTEGWKRKGKRMGIMPHLLVHGVRQLLY